MSAPTPETLTELRALRADLLPWLIGSPADQAPCDRGELRTLLDPLPALLDAAAERDALAAKLAEVRALHIAHDCTSHAGIATICAHRPGICLACREPLPCPTIRALDTTPDAGGES